MKARCFIIILKVSIYTKCDMIQKLYFSYNAESFDSVSFEGRKMFKLILIFGLILPKMVDVFVIPDLIS